MRRTGKTVAVIGVMILGFVLIFGMLNLYHARQVGQDDRADLRQEITSTRADLSKQEAAAQALSDQVKSLGAKPVVNTGKASKSSILPTLIPGLRGPRGFAGKDGKDSKVPGPAGKDSKVPGPAGSKGASVIGPRGPAGKSIKGDTGSAGKDSQVPGPKGDTGSAGKNAPTPTGVTCTDGSGKFTFTYSDGAKLTANCSPTPVAP